MKINSKFHAIRKIERSGPSSGGRRAGFITSHLKPGYVHWRLRICKFRLSACWMIATDVHVSSRQFAVAAFGRTGGSKSTAGLSRARYPPKHSHGGFKGEFGLVNLHHAEIDGVLAVGRLANCLFRPNSW